MDWIIDLLGGWMGGIYGHSHHYVGSLMAFALVTKLALLPLAVWVQKNSIKMVAILPELNRIKANYFGHGDMIAQEQALLYKKAGYNPFISLIPLCLQIGLLMAVIQVIYHPLTVLLALEGDVVAHLAELTVAVTGVDSALASLEIAIVRTVQDPAFTQMFLDSGVDASIISPITRLNMTWLGLHLGDTPIEVMGGTLAVPLLAGASAWWMCWAQNKANVLQGAQSSANQWGSLLLSVGLSLYLGLFVPVGVGVYWIFGNVYAVFQLYALNLAIPPKNYVDFADLEASRQALDALRQAGGPRRTWYQKDPNARREKQDYKRFFAISNKKLVFYSERSGYYKYFKSTIEQLLAKSNITIHYVTSDPADAIFTLAETQPKIKPYYIGEKKLIVLMMKMDADMVVATLPDLNRFHIKKSYVREDVHYVYLPHDMLSTHMGFMKGALDHYDTIFCAGAHQVAEIRETEALYHLPEKTLVPFGSGVMEDLLEIYREKRPANQDPGNKPEKPLILIAPSWQGDNLFDSCIDEMIQSLSQGDYRLVLRPHPEYCKRFGAKMNALVSQYPPEQYPHITFELDFSVNESIYRGDLLITDWSAIAFEFSFCTMKPSLFVNTAPKVLNEDYHLYKNIPKEISLRDQVGVSMEKSQVPEIRERVERLLDDTTFREKILATREATIFHLGESGQRGAGYILDYLKQKK